MLVAAPVAAGTYFFTNSWVYTAMTVILGVLVDVDHVFDYIREEHRFDIKDMFIKSYKGDFEKFYCIFHAWEYIPLAWLAGVMLGNFTFPVVFTIAYGAHLLPDQLMNNTRPFGYFLTYRIIKGFRMEELYYSTGRWIPNDKDGEKGRFKK